MTDGAVGRNIVMVKSGEGPVVGGMTIVTGSIGDDMRSMLTGGSVSIMAGCARRGHTGMVEV